MYITSCPICGNTVVYESFDESVAGLNCPHCERRKNYEAELAKEYFLDDTKKSMNFLERRRQLELKDIPKRPAPPL